MNPIARIDLFGRPKLFVDGQAVRLTVRQAALFSLFVLRGTSTVNRSHAATLLWPESSTARGRHSLSQALYALKQQTGGVALIEGDPTELLLRGTVSDVAEFQRAVGSADWPTAARLFRGALLDGIELPHAHEFNSWLDALRIYYVGVASEVLSELRLDGSAPIAAALASRLPPEHVSALHDSRSRIEEPIPPMGSRRSWDVDIDPEGMVGSGGSLPFVGRRAEMDALESLFVNSVVVGFTCIAIEGEPGIGKTALAERFARLRTIRGTRVLLARGFLAERNVPFGVVAQWLRDFGPERLSAVEPRFRGILNEAFPDTTYGHHTSSDQEVGDPFGQYRLLEALRQTFLVLTGDGPPLLLLDDAHWADAASLGFLHYFARRSAAVPTVVLATVRNPSLHGHEPFAHWERVDRFLLGPLSQDDTAALVTRYRQRGSVSNEVALKDICRRTGRNPLLLVSLLTTAQGAGKPEIPDSVTNFFVPRLDALSRDAIVVLAAVSLAGGESSFDLLAGVAGMPRESPRLVTALTDLEHAALIVAETDSVVRPRHAIVGEIAVSRLTAPDRKALYGRAARILSEEGRSSPAVLAVHHDIAGERNRAFENAVSAAAASQELHATREHEFFLKLALSNAPDPSTEAEIRIQLSVLYRSLGRLTEGLDIISESSISRAPVALRRQARLKRLAIQLVMGNTNRTNAQVWEEVDGSGELVPPELLAELYLDFAAAAHDSGERSYAVLAAKRASEIVEQLPSTPQTALLAIRSAMVSGLYSSVDQGIDSVERTLPIARSSVEALSIWLPAHATLLLAAGRLVEAEEVFLEAIQLIERYCLYGKLFSLHNNLGVCYTDQGRFANAVTQLEEASRVARELGGAGEPTVVADNLAMLHLERGDYELALRTVRGALTSTSSRSPRELFHRHALTGLCSLELGLLAQAFEAKREIELLLQQHEYWGSDVSYVETFLARMLVMEGRPEVARARLEAAVEIYRPRDLMCRARLELELARLDLKENPAAALERAESMLATLCGTGARPLIDRFEELADRARRHAG